MTKKKAKKKTKVSSAKRFGTRYGLKLRKQVNEIEKLQRKKHICPKCKKHSVKRLSTGIFECKKCSTKFTGRAYIPK